MTSPANSPPPKFELVPASRAHEPILANLLQLYAHDFSEFHDIEINGDGRFTYNQLPLYFTEPNSHPFLIAIDDKPAGFVFVKKGSELTGNQHAWDMAEFFILRAHRRRGLGTRIASQIFSRFPGPWEVRVMHSNSSAKQFWASAIENFTGMLSHPITIEKESEPWNLFTFDSKPTP
ncbi:MAG TPA: GNAT family N-acetyltransferase [Acidisarcina sp.]